MATVSLVRFVLDLLRLGLPLAAVERVVHTVELTPLPGSPDRVAGAFNLEGQVVPVLDLRRSFGLAWRAPGLDDHYLVARSNGRLVALLVDEVQDIAEIDAGAVVRGDAIIKELEGLEGIAVLEDGLLLISDPDRFLDPDDRSMLERALDEARHDIQEAGLGGS